VLAGHSPTASYDYAERVTNLVETFQQGRRELDEQQKAVSFDNKAEVIPAVETVEGIRFRVLQDPPHFVIAAG